MSSHALAYPVADLVREQVAAGSHKTHPQPPAWLVNLAAPFSRLLAWHLDRQARNLSARAVWFQGALARTPAEPSGILMDADGSLQQLLEEFEVHILDLRADVLGLITEFEKFDGKRNGPVRDACRRVASASADLFEVVQALRWAVMEHDAQADIGAGRVSPAFTSVDDLLASLHQD